MRVKSAESEISTQKSPRLVGTEWRKWYVFEVYSTNKYYSRSTLIEPWTPSSTDASLRMTRHHYPINAALAQTQNWRAPRKFSRHHGNASLSRSRSQCDRAMQQMKPSECNDRPSIRMPSSPYVLWKRLLGNWSESVLYTKKRMSSSRRCGPRPLHRKAAIWAPPTGLLNSVSDPWFIQRSGDNLNILISCRCGVVH